MFKLYVLALLFTGALCDKWIDICGGSDAEEYDCCDESTMKGHEYLIRTATDDFEGQKMDCILEDFPHDKYDQHVVVFESRKEYICVMKFLAKEKETYGPVYIGLKADVEDDMKNLFQWEWGTDEVGFTAWDPASPSGKGDCVTVSVGKTNAKSGMWTDSLCTTALPIICERQPKDTGSTTIKASSSSGFY